MPTAHAVSSTDMARWGVKALMAGEAVNADRMAETFDIVRADAMAGMIALRELAERAGLPLTWVVKEGVGAYQADSDEVATLGSEGVQ